MHPHLYTKTKMEQKNKEKAQKVEITKDYLNTRQNTIKPSLKAIIKQQEAEREGNRNNATVNIRDKELIEGKTYEEHMEELEKEGKEKGGSENQLYQAKHEGSKARKHNYGPGAYNQGNNVTYDCNRCGIHTENGTGYSNNKTIAEFEEHCEGAEGHYQGSYGNGEKATWGLYCPIDAAIKGYSHAYPAEFKKYEAYLQFDGGRDGKCGTDNGCVEDRKHFLDDKEAQEKKCLTKQAWEAGKEATKDDLRVNSDRAEGLYDYEAYATGFKEGSKGKINECKLANERGREKARARGEAEEKEGAE